MQADSLDVVHVQIHKDSRERAGKLAQAYRLENRLRISFERRSVTNQHNRGSEAKECLARGGNHRRVSVHHAEWIEPDEIRFQQDRFAPNRQIELSQGLAENRGEIGLVPGHASNGHARYRPLEGR